MKKVLLLVTAVVFLSLASGIVGAQGMMGGSRNPSTVDIPSSSAAKEEAEGRVVWDKLQNKEIKCNDLSDDDFDVLGDFFMGNMMGSNHESMNQMLAQRLGDNGEKQMHIALGKRLSGCDPNATLPDGASYFMPMMGFSATGMMDKGSYNSFGKGASGMAGYNRYSSMMGGSFEIFKATTWIALIVFLVSGSAFFIKEFLRKKSK